MIDIDRAGSAPRAPWPQGLEGALGTALAELLVRAEIALSAKELAGGTHVYVNPPMAALLGRSVEEVVGQTDAQLLEPAPWATLRNAELAALARSGPTASDLKLEIAGATREFTVWRTTFSLDAQAQAPTHLVALWFDHTQARRRDAQLQLALTQLEQQQRANDQLRREMQDSAVRDAVTGLGTRAHFEDQLRREVDLSTREHREFALVEIVIDAPTDSVIAGGDAARLRVIEALGRLLRSNTRAMDAACRSQEDRFAVLLSGVGLATAHSRMEQLRRQCATQIVVLDGRELGFSVSMGVASFPHTANTREGLLQACEDALDQARLRGGNTVALASIRFESP
jgi:diguanylate cyclase (GGDEF)-like protein